MQGLSNILPAVDHLAASRWSCAGFINVLRSFNTLKRSIVIILTLFVCSLYGQGDQKGTQNSLPSGNRIHYGDIVEVDLVGSLEFDWRGGLTPDGFLDGLERVESPVYALCRNEMEVAAAITEQFRKILREPNVVVRVIDRSNRALAYVSGAVKNPQRFQLRRPVTLTELVVLSGGVTDSSNGEISVFRPPFVNCRPAGSSEPTFENAATQTPKRFLIKIADLINGDPSADVQILSGDIVSVIAANPVFVLTDGGSPRRLNLTPELDLNRALTSAGIVLKDLAKQKVRIYRRSASGSPLEADIRRIIDGKEAPPKLEPYDVIVVQKKGNHETRPADAANFSRSEANALGKLPLRIVD